MLGSAQPHPLAKAIAEIVSNANLLTPDQQELLMKALPDGTVKKRKRGDTGMPNVGDMLENMEKTMNRLTMLAVGSENIDDIKKVMTAQKDLMAQVMKFGEQIGALNRQVFVENAVVQAFDELGDAEMKKKYLDILAKNLAKSGEK